MFGRKAKIISDEIISKNKAPVRVNRERRKDFEARNRTELSARWEGKCRWAVVPWSCTRKQKKWETPLHPPPSRSRLEICGRESFSQSKFVAHRTFWIWWWRSGMFYLLRCAKFGIRTKQLRRSVERHWEDDLSAADLTCFRMTPLRGRKIETGTQQILYVHKWFFFAHYKVRRIFDFFFRKKSFSIRWCYTKYLKYISMRLSVFQTF